MSPRFAAWLALLALSAACGIPTDDEPRSIPAEQLPVDLGRASTAAPGAQTTGTTQYAVYFVAGQHLVPVTRSGSVTFSTEQAVDAVLAGPTEDEQARGLRSAVPRSTRLLGVSSSEGLVVLDLSSDFATASGEQQLLAVAQLVLSTAPLGGRVGFALEGEPVEVPRQDGTLVPEAAPDDYRTLAGQPDDDVSPTVRAPPPPAPATSITESPSGR